MTYKNLDRAMTPVPREAGKSEECGISYAEWKAAQLNPIFAEHGVLGEPGRITAQTIQDGLAKRPLNTREA